MKGIKCCLLTFVWLISIGIPLVIRGYTNFEVILISFFSLILIAGATIDMHYCILPDEGAIGLSIGGVLYSTSKAYAVFDTCMVLLSVFVLCVGLRYVSNNGFGWGDIKWLCAISLWLTPIQTVVMIYVAFIVGTLYLFLLKLLKKGTISYLPFGPFLCFGAWNGLHLHYVWEALYWKLVFVIGSMNVVLY